jgi:hypothetical protein
VAWVILTYHLPAEPSRHRVAVWRELRRAGAVSLQQATWAVPAQADFVGVVSKAVALIERADGDALVFDAAPRGEAMAAQLEALFTADREEEWQEFLAECDKYDAEIDKEIRIKKFTRAELDEEEQSLERLQRWSREIRARDLFGAPSHDEAERRLKECTEHLEDFAERVYEHGRGT